MVVVVIDFKSKFFFCCLFRLYVDATHILIDVRAYVTMRLRLQ